MEKRIFGRKYNTDTAKLVAFKETETQGGGYYAESVYRKRNGVYVGGCVIVPLDIIDVDTIVKVVDGCELDKRDYKCPGIDDCGRFEWFYYCIVVHSECDPNMFRC